MDTLQRIGRAGVLALAVALIAAPIALGPEGKAAASASMGSTLRVGTWNLKWFGHPKYPRNSNSLGAIAGEMASWGVDVLAFQEVAVTRLGPKGEPRAYAMDELVTVLADEHGQSWEYWLHKGKGEQHLGFIWRTDHVDLVAAPLYGLKAKAVDNVIVKKGKKAKVKKTPFWRTPVIAHVQAGDGLTDFTLINVHLKASEHQYGKDSFWETRRAACESIAGWVQEKWGPPAGPEPKKKIPKKKPSKPKKPAVMKPGPAPQAKLFAVPFVAVGQASKQSFINNVLSYLDPDLAVLGDFNAPLHAEMDAEPLLGLGMHFLGTEEATHQSGAPLDRVIVSVPMGEEHAHSMGSSPPGQAFAVSSNKKGGSDHFLVSFTVAVRADDD